MVESGDIRRKVKEHRIAAGLIGFFAALQLILLVKIWSAPLVWDTAIYIAMGKHLFTGGEIGLWEVFRPPLLPVIAGTLWKAGMPTIGFTRLLAVLFSVTGAGTVYYMVENAFGRKKAIYTLAVLLSTGLYVQYTTKLLTGLPASILVFTSLYLVLRHRPVSGGVFGGLAFLMRFPSALVGPAAVAYILYEGYRQDDYRAAFWRALTYSAGFFALAVPYLVAMKFYYGSFLEPFVSGVAVPASNPDKYLAGVYYIINVAKTNPLTLLALPGIYTVVKQRKGQMYVFLSGLVFLYGFFTFFPHKETRFALLFLPLIALFAAEGYSFVMDRFEFSFDNTAPIIIVAALVLLGSFSTVYMNEGVNQDAVDYYGAHSNLSGVVASNDASIMAYGDIEYFALPPSTLEGSFDNAKEKADYFSINSCAWYCTPSIDRCEERIDTVESEIRGSYEKVFELNGSYCTYGIYRVGG